MLQTILILFAAGAAGGLTIGSKVAMKEVEIMFAMARSGRTRCNRKWESIKSGFRKNKTWSSVKKSYRVNRGWNEVKNDFGKNDKWNSVKRNVKDYRATANKSWEKQSEKWSAIRFEQKKDRFDVSGQYLVNQTSDKK